MNKKAIIMFVGVGIILLFVIIIIFSSILKDKEEVFENSKIKDEYNELADINSSDQGVEGYYSGNEEYQNPEFSMYEDMMEGVVSLEDGAEKYPNYFNLNFYDFDEEEYQRIISEAIESANNNEIEDAIQAIDNYLMYVSEKENDQAEFLFSIRESLTAILYVHNIHGLKNIDEDEPYNEELDISFIKEVTKLIPFKELVTPYYFNINHRLLVEIISNGEGLAPVVLDLENVSYGEIKKYEGHNLYEIEGVYGKGKEIYQQDIVINGETYTAIIVGSDNEYFLWKVDFQFDETGLPQKPTSNLNYKTVSDWRNYYKEVLKHQAGGNLR